jgi:hypothetical protein
MMLKRCGAVKLKVMVCAAGLLVMGGGRLPGAENLSNEVFVSSRHASVAKVAVFVEPDMPPYGSPLDLSAPVILRILGREGIHASAVSADDLADPVKFNAKRYAVLVLTTATAYPKAALPNLHAYRAAGGCLVTSGFAFYTGYERQDKKWVAAPPEGKQAPAFGHGPGGVGTGTYGVMKEDANLDLSVPTNILSFACDNPNGERKRRLWLDARGLDARDKVCPLLTLRDPEGGNRPAAALVQHGCETFPGAWDLWLGGFQLYYDITDRNVIEQMLLKGILWCLKEKGALTPDQHRKRVEALSQRQPMGELPGKLVYEESPRPWKDSFLPKGAAPARSLLVVNTAGLGVNERIALTCLQGLLAREQPRMWLIRQAFAVQDREWLERHKTAGFIEGWEEIADWTLLFKRFAGACRGAVVADPGLYRGDLLALNVAMCEDLIVATPELAERLGLPVKVDLRGRFTTYAEGLRWVWSTYQRKFNRFVCDYMYPERLANCVFDYDYQWRAPVFWIVGIKDADKPGADASEEFSVIGQILAQMAPQSAVLGFPAQGELGAGEPMGVQLASRYGRGLVCTDSMANLSVMSGVTLGHLPQRRPAPPPLDRDKLYVAMAMSDGDNLNCWSAGFFRRYFDHPGHGSVPVAYTMGPELLELAPVVAKWFFEHAATNTEFICGVAGITYTAPQYYGAGYSKPAAAQAGFMKWTAHAMQALDMRSLNITPGGKDGMADYARGLPFCHSLVYGWSRDAQASIPALAYTLPTGMPGFDCATPAMPADFAQRQAADKLFPAKTVIADLAGLVGKSRPAFLYMIMPNWNFDMENLAYIGSNAPTNVVFVTPSQLAELYRMEAGQGQGKVITRGQQR